MNECLVWGGGRRWETGKDVAARAAADVGPQTHGARAGSSVRASSSSLCYGALTATSANSPAYPQTLMSLFELHQVPPLVRDWVDLWELVSNGQTASSPYS